MKLLLPLILLISHCLVAQQMFQGPASGSVPSGIIKNTNDYFSEDLPGTDLLSNDLRKGENDVNNQFSYNKQDIKMFNTQKTFYKFPVINSLSVEEELNFEGPNVAGCWVPDCNVTPGPVDILIAINSIFWITDRSGNLIKQIDVNSWYSDFIGTGLVFDPKSFYDYRTKRFYMIYLYRDSSTDETLFLVSVSDDSSAEGSWNNWAVRGDLNGSTVADHYVDFPSLIVSDNAMYVAVDAIPHTGGNPVYSKLRAFPLNDLVQDSPGELNYTDLWDFRNPRFPNSILRTLKLAHDFDESENVYLTGFNVNTAPQNYIGIYEINDVFGSTTVNAISVDTSPFQLTPHMLQKGGNIPVQLFHLFYSEMFKRNDKIYIVHSTKDGSLASIHYMEVNTNSWELDDEIIKGSNGYYYGYPDLIVDEHDNAFMVFQRSSANEYPGAFYSVKAANDDNFGDDIPLMNGLGNMSILGCGSTFNYVRFGDYTDIMFDPIEQDKIWLMGEYVGSDNRSKTRIGKINVDLTSSIDSNVEEYLPDIFTLYQNYPNPFNPATNIKFEIENNAFVKVTVYDEMGQQIRLLADGEFSRGIHNLTWNGKDDNGVEVSSGVYLTRITINNKGNSIKMIFIK
jgi:hypothetical protein